MNNTGQPVTPKPAATIILLRDGNSGLEVLILRKASGKHFASGALVFPGGKVDAADTAFNGDIGEERNELSDLKIAAIREMYEECGIALVRVHGAEKLLDAQDVAAHQDTRERSNQKWLRQFPWSHTDRLMRFAHWITPPGHQSGSTPTSSSHRRRPADGTNVDGYEIVEAQWHRPQSLLDDVHAGDVKLVLPTMMNIMKLSEVGDLAAAIALAQERIIIPVTPTRIETPDGERLVIPEEAGYGLTEIPTEFLRSA